MSAYRTPGDRPKRFVSLDEARARAKWARVRARRREQARAALIRRWTRPVVGTVAFIFGVSLGGEVAWWTGPQEFEHYCRFIVSVIAIVLIVGGVLAVAIPKEKS